MDKFLVKIIPSDLCVSIIEKDFVYGLASLVGVVDAC